MGVRREPIVRKKKEIIALKKRSADYHAKKSKGDQKSTQKQQVAKTQKKTVESQNKGTQKKEGVLTKKPESKATQAKKLSDHGKKRAGVRKVRHSVTFRRPHTLRQKRSPRYPRKQLISTWRSDNYRVVKNPVTSECSMKKIEDCNTLTFVVDNGSNKHKIKRAVKALYNVNVEKVNVQNGHNGRKIAFVRLTTECDAADTANKIGII